MSAELAEFILARIAEVEQMARDAGGGVWIRECDSGYGPSSDECCEITGDGIRNYDLR